MNKEFENISEAVLFDNLKRSANKWLRKLNDERDTTRKLENFRGKYPTIIQALLKDVGKQFFKIFLYQSIKSNLSKKAFTDYEKIEILKKTVKNFKFYFYPGYTILNGTRIFITGNKKSINTDDKFLTGIGTTFIQIDSFEKLFDFLTNKDARPNLIFDFEGEFWIDDIPSTIALDNLLNQHYVNKEVGENKFIVPSTHFWKSHQKRNDGSFMPMPLKSDDTELRILKVSIGDKRITYGNNQIEISIKPSELLESGFTIAKYLDKDKIPIAWKKETDKDSYKPWPYINKAQKLPNVEDDNLGLELMAYSFWIAETLNAENIPALNYKNIRKAFNKSNLQLLSKKIYPFKKYHNNTKGLTEIYYNHWYTLFLESFGKEVDLGTAMFLASDEYDPEFLMKCANWLRWIYNELRLIEATAKEFLETENYIFKLLKHSQKHYINALENSVSKESETALVCLSILKGHFDLIESISLKGNENNLKINEEPTKFSITRVLNEHKSLFVTILNGNSFDDVIKNITPDIKSRFRITILELLTNSNKNPEVEIISFKGVIQLILKELIINALENIDIDNPIFNLKLNKVNQKIEIEVCNSISNFSLNKISEIYSCFNEKIGVPKSLGWWMICRLVNVANIEIRVNSLAEMKKENVFKTIITIKDGE